jgi:beta-glucosidase/6-phospho-beta-glucosidase/beta-galactosidase
MSQSFLQILKKQHGDGDYEGDQFGGATGTDGSGIPMGSPSNFMFATGIECSYPRVKAKNNRMVRRDQLEECEHYERYADDLGLVKEMGLKFLRYGLPYHRIHLGPGKFDWEWSDAAMGEMHRLEIEPILDLCHFGVPDWIESFQNPDFPLHFAGYCEAVAKRYPWVRFYTPVNEIFVAARMSARDGVWNECQKDDRAFITALKHLVAASILGNHRIATVRPNCVIVQSESAEYIHEAVASESMEIKLSNELRFLSLDLLYANPTSSLISNFAMDNGLTRDEWNWFMKGEPPGYQIMGHDYYGRNEQIKLADGRMCSAEDVLGWHGMARDYYLRYRKPIMHTETNVFDADFAPCWMWKQWMNVLRLRQEGVPVVGFTWYSLTDQIDWDTGLAQLNHRVNECGLYDLDRKIRKVGQEYRLLLEQFGRITAVPGGELFERTEKPARLKIEV